MGQTFGQLDPNATNDVMGGKTVATGTPGAQTMADPNKGLSGGQMFARKALSGGLSGMSQGLTQPGMQGRMQGPNQNFYGGQ